MRIDSHVHFWHYEKEKDAWITSKMKVLQQNYFPQDIEPSFKRNGIDGCIAVQATQTELETLFLVELSKTHEVIKGVVGWVDLQKENIGQRLEYFSQFPVIRGWRHGVQSEQDDFLKRGDFRNGISALQSFGYTYDLLIYPRQLKAAMDLVSHFPDQKFVIDHCAKPDIAGNKIKEWEPLIREMASYPNVSCKLSGLITEAKPKEWSPADIYPYLDVVFDAFGPGRLLFGSDWPVILLAGIYVQWKSLVEKYMSKFIPDEVQQVFGGNAEDFYGIGGQRPADDE